MGVGGKVQFWAILGAFVPVQESGWGSNGKEMMMAGVGVHHKAISVLGLMLMVKSHVAYPKSLMDTSPEEGDRSGRWSPPGFSMGSGSISMAQPSSWKPPLRVEEFLPLCWYTPQLLPHRSRLWVEANSKDTVSQHHRGIVKFGKNWFHAYPDQSPCL